MRVSLRDAVAEFQGAVCGSYWEEHGISDEEAANGLRAVWKDAGIEWDEDCLFYCGQLTTEVEEAERIAREEKRAEERAAWRLANPKEAALQDTIERQLEITRSSIVDRIADDIFKPSPFFQMLRNK